MAARRVQHQPAYAGRGEALRPWQQGSAAQQEHVDAGPGALDVRPRPPAADRLAEGEFRKEPDRRRRQYRRARKSAVTGKRGPDREKRVARRHIKKKRKDK